MNPFRLKSSPWCRSVRAILIGSLLAHGQLHGQQQTSSSSWSIEEIHRAGSVWLETTRNAHGVPFIEREALALKRTAILQILQARLAMLRVLSLDPSRPLSEISDPVYPEALHLLYSRISAIPEAAFPEFERAQQEIEGEWSYIRSLEPASNPPPALWQQWNERRQDFDQRVYVELVGHAITLAEIRRKIQFLDVDYWAFPETRSALMAALPRWETDEAGSPFSYTEQLDRLVDRAKQSGGFIAQIQMLRGLEQTIFSWNPLLMFREQQGGLDLAQDIYNVLIQSAGFPKTHGDEAPRELYTTLASRPFQEWRQIPEAFEFSTRLRASIHSMQSLGGGRSQRLKSSLEQKIFRVVRTQYQRQTRELLSLARLQWPGSLVAALSNPHWRVILSSPGLFMTSMHHFRGAGSVFRWAEFHRELERAKRIIAETQQLRRSIRSISFGLGMACGGVGSLGSLAGISLSSLSWVYGVGFTADLFTLSLSQQNALQISTQAQSSEAFLGVGRAVAADRIATVDRFLSVEARSQLLRAALAVGVDLPWIRVLQGLGHVGERALGGLYVVRPEQWRVVANSLAQWERISARMFGNLGVRNAQRLLASIRNTGVASRVRSMEEALSAAANHLGVSRVALVARLRQNPLLDAALDSGAALYADPYFLRQLYLDVTSDLALGFAFSAGHHGVFSGGGWDALRSNSRDIIANMSVSLFETIAMDVMAFFHGRRIVARQSPHEPHRPAATIYDPGHTDATRGDLVRRMLLSNGIIGLSSGLVGGLIESENPTTESVVRRMGFDASFLALHASPREHMKLFLTQSIQHSLLERRGSPIILGPASRLLSGANDFVSWSQYVQLVDLDFESFINPNGAAVRPRFSNPVSTRLFPPTAGGQERGHWAEPLVQ